MKPRYLYIIIAFFWQLSIALQSHAAGWPKVYQPFDSITNLLENEDKFNLSKENCEELILQMEAIVGKEGPYHNILRWRLLYWKAWVNRKTNKEGANKMLKQAISLVDTVNFRYDYMKMLRLYSSHDLTSFNNPAAEYYNLRKVIGYAEEIKDTFLLSEGLLSQGILLSFLGDGTRAIQYLELSNSYLLSSGRKKMALNNKMNIAETYDKIGQKDTAYYILKNLLLEPLIQEDSSMVASIYSNIVYHCKNDDERHFYSQRAYEMATQIGMSSLWATAAVNRGYSFLQNNTDSALYYYDQVWQYLHTTDDLNVLFPTLLGLMDCHYRRGNFKEVADFANIYVFYQDSIKQDQQILAISNLEQLHAIEQYEQNLAQEKELARVQRIILYLTAALLSLLVIGLGYIIVLQRRQNRLKEQNRQLELDAKNRELTAHELKSIEKNRMLEELEKRISEGREQGEIDRQAAMELRSQINAHVKHENEWQNFQVQFEQVYPDFYRTLKAIAPTLTEGELRLCAYIRTGMDNKQIASMLSQQPDSVKKSRYRLRKKLPLTTDDSLEDFLRNL